MADKCVIVGTVQGKDNPQVSYTIKRVGERRDQGGKGVSWQCSCPTWKRSKKGMCHHLLFVFKKKFSNSGRQVLLTKEGQKLLFPDLVVVDAEVLNG